LVVVAKIGETDHPSKRGLTFARVAKHSQENARKYLINDRSIFVNTALLVHASTWYLMHNRRWLGRSSPLFSSRANHIVVSPPLLTIEEQSANLCLVFDNDLFTTSAKQRQYLIC
jgi:hypothetical protein